MSSSSNLRAVNLVLPEDKLLKLPNGLLAINEIFLSVQGEGAQTGLPMVFVRFAECNLRCTKKNAGFDCDTEFSGYRELTSKTLLSEIEKFKDRSAWVIFTGGEPALQVTSELISQIHAAGWKIAIETNGTVKLPSGIDWITVSPKSAEHTLRQRRANELKYVRAAGMALPAPTIEAEHFFISPAFQADGSVDKTDLEWCLKLVGQSPAKWRISVQLHKLLNLR